MEKKRDMFLTVVIVLVALQFLKFLAALFFLMGARWSSIVITDIYQPLPSWYLFCDIFLFWGGLITTIGLWKLKRKALYLLSFLTIVEFLKQILVIRTDKEISDFGPFIMLIILIFAIRYGKWEFFS